MLLLLRILGPQLLALMAYAVLRLAAPRRDAGIAQLFAVVIAGSSAWWSAAIRIGGIHLSMPRAGAFVALEIFVALLAQLLILAAQSE